MYKLRETSLAVLVATALVLVGVAQADNTAYRTAKNGWSTKPSCKYDRGVKVCWAVSIGKAILDDGGANLSYMCRDDDSEGLSVNFVGNVPFDKKSTTIAATWVGEDGEFRESVKVRTEYYDGFQYYYFPEDPRTFLRRLHEHEKARISLPVRYGRPYKLIFRLTNAVSSIARTMKACGITNSYLLPLPR